MNEIGNDIVDRSEWSLNPPHHRFAMSVLCAEEFFVWRSRGSCLIYLQRIWTAKESVYKLMRRHNSHLPFRPNRMHYLENQSVVVADSAMFKVEHIISSEFIYAYATVGKPLRAISRISRIGGSCASSFRVAGDASRMVREIGRQMLFDYFHLLPETVEFIKGPDGSSRVLASGLRLPISLSFTHEGAFVAAAISFESKSQVFSAINMNQ